MTFLRSRRQGPVRLSLLLLIGSFGGQAASAAQMAGLQISTMDEIGVDAKAVHCANSGRLDAVRELFQKIGADPSSMAVESFKSVENLVVRKPGNTSEMVVLSAHYDKVPPGCGSIDNWSGITALAHLYRSARSVETRKTFLFVAFGREEDGMIGSREMVKKIGNDEALNICAVINIDSLGMGAPQADDTISDKKLVQLAASVAERMNLTFAHAEIPGASSDSDSFREKKIPAMTIHGLTRDYRRVLHSGRDVPEVVDNQSVYLGYRLALGVLARVDEAACDSWR